MIFIRDPLNVTVSTSDFVVVVVRSLPEICSLVIVKLYNLTE